MLAYCTAFGLPTGHLVYAKGDTNPTTHIVRQTGTTIGIWALDLSAPTAHILNQLRTLATAIAGTHRA
jgi:5-methylcytosine-specific restriction enzyme subunit McrC